jgi:hypothetical protein
VSLEQPRWPPLPTCRSLQRMRIGDTTLPPMDFKGSCLSIMHIYTHMPDPSLLGVHRLLRVQLPPELLQSALPPVPADPTTQLAQLHRPTGSRPAQQRLQHPLVSSAQQTHSANVDEHLDTPLQNANLNTLLTDLTV